MKKIPLSARIETAISTTADRVKLLREMEIRTVGDFLQNFPRTHEISNPAESLSDARGDRKNILRGEFAGVENMKTRTGKILTKAVFVDQNGDAAECVWFSQPRMKNLIPVGKPVFLSGAAKLNFGRLNFQNPSFELADSGGFRAAEILPVYRETGKLSPNWWREKMWQVLDFAEDFAEIIPAEIRTENNLVARAAAIREIHFPKNEKNLAAAKKTLAFGEIFILAAAAEIRKKNWQSSAAKLPEKLDADLQKKFFATLPFEFTNSQKIALFEILKDFEKPAPALRLLQGDVGSGKTIVAAAAALPFLKNKKQVAFLCPTEILAAQHFENLKKIFAKFDPEISVEFLTGAVLGKKRKEILEKLKSGEIHFLIGTHALIQETVVFRNLEFCIIDEQHRFGVKQREVFLKNNSPHILQTTATPIPRSLAIVAFGDHDLSVISEKPAGRKKILTKVVPPTGRREIEFFIESEIKKGRQVFVICPLVEFSEKLEAKSATDEFEKLRKVWPNLKIGLLHGRLNSTEKNETMEKFKNGEIEILVATAVVEVGVDVPNATIICIETPERFGLAQLHQFRGRVGRGEAQSYCFLFPEKNATERLRALEKFDDGFKLAEIDLKLRGPGEVFGTAQSGEIDFRFVDIFDGRLISAAKNAAVDFLEGKNLNDLPTALKNLIEKKLEKMAATI